MTMKRMILAAVGLTALLALAGCAPEVGSDEWCEDMREKPKKDWTAAEAGDYAKHCLLK